MIPASLDEWTYEAISALCEAGHSESERHDFKLGLPDPYNLTKLCCAFANSGGGFVVVGVRDSQPFEIIGVDPDKELFSEFVGKVRASPDIRIDQPKFIAISSSESLLYVFEIKRSQRSPHLPTKEDERVFWKRQGPSCVQMTLEEIRYQMNNYEEKVEKLTLLSLDIKYKVQSLQEEDRLPDGLYSGELFSFEIIDRVMVEAFSFLKSDPDVFTKLNTFKRRLSELNSHKQKLITALAVSDGSLIMEIRAQGLSARKVYRSELQSAMHHLTILGEQIERVITEVRDHS